jgi:hypothetical protein
MDGANLRCLKPPIGEGRLCNVMNHGNVGKQSAMPVDPRLVVQAISPTQRVAPTGTATKNQTQQTAQGENALILLIVPSLKPIQGLEVNSVSRWHHNHP